MQLLGIAEDEDYGDYTDITEGRDFNIEAVEADIVGKKGIKCTLRVKPKTTPVSTDSTLVETWLEEQPDILEINRKHTYEEIKVILQNWLNPEEAEEDDTITLATPAPVVDDLPWKDEDDSATSKATEKKLGAKKAKTSEKFDALFTED
jgi:hypothetical protein